jgi:ankyrin repeat protein
MFSSELGHPDITQWLLEFKADAAAADTNGTTALMFAAKGGHTTVAKALLAAGAPLHAVNAKGSTALHFAAGGGTLQVSNTLLLLCLYEQRNCCAVMCVA